MRGMLKNQTDCNKIRGLAVTVIAKLEIIIKKLDRL